LYGYVYRRCDGYTEAADEVADLCNTISYEVLCAIGKRVPRLTDVFIQKPNHRGHGIIDYHATGIEHT